MRQEVKLLKDFFTKKSIGGEISINDLHEKEFAGQKLSMQEKEAIRNYNNYRIKLLNSLGEDEEAFHKVYRQLQVVANLGDWKEFLKPEYTSGE